MKYNLRLESRLVRVAIIFIFLAIFVSVFVWLASYVRQGQLLPFDEPVLRWLRDHRNNYLTFILLIVTQLGGVAGVTILTCSTVAVIIRRHMHKTQAWFVGLTVAGAGLLNVILKLLFERERPDFLQHLVHETSYSFPSGHAMGSSALVFALLFLMWRSKWRWWGVAVGVLFMLAVGVSRMYFGVHYPSDILAGWLVSFVWTSLVYGVLYGYTKRKQRKGTHGKIEQSTRD